MNQIFEGIREGLKEAIAMERGKIKPAEAIEIPDSPKEVRARLKLSQSEFAKFIGVNEYTLKNWEQGKRRIPAPARTLFKIDAAYPEIILEMRGR